METYQAGTGTQRFLRSLHRMELLVHATPNPLAYRFVSSRELLPEGQAEWTRDNYPAGFPLLDAAFANPEVVRVYAAGFNMTVVKHPDADWGSLTLPVRRALQAILLEAEAPLLPHAEVPPMPPVPMAEDFRTRILPATAQDGGAIWLNSIEDGQLLVHTAGACTACPYLPQTLSQGILQPLQARHPDLRSVRVVA